MAVAVAGSRHRCTRPARFLLGLRLRAPGRASLPRPSCLAPRNRRMAFALLSAGQLAPSSHAPSLPDRQQARKCVRSCASAAQDSPMRENPFLIKIPPRKPLQPMPQPIQVIHSPAYLYEMRSLELRALSSESTEPEPVPTRSMKSQSLEEFDGTPLEWALSRRCQRPAQTRHMFIPQVSASAHARVRHSKVLYTRECCVSRLRHSVPHLVRADETLDEMERNPNQATLALWRASRSPVAAVTAAGVRGAASLTLTAGTNALKVAAPVGLWAVREGFKAAIGFLSVLASENKKSKRRKRQQALEGSQEQGEAAEVDGAVGMDGQESQFKDAHQEEQLGLM